MCTLTHILMFYYLRARRAEHIYAHLNAFKFFRLAACGLELLRCKEYCSGSCIFCRMCNKEIFKQEHYALQQARTHMPVCHPPPTRAAHDADQQVHLTESAWAWDHGWGGRLMGTARLHCQELRYASVLACVWVCVRGGDPCS